MNKKQKFVLWIGIIILLLMALFPPWTTSYEISEMGIHRRGRFDPDPVEVKESVGGYGFILSPPRAAVRVDTGRLLAQWVIVALIKSGLLYTFKDKKPKDE